MKKIVYLVLFILLGGTSAYGQYYFGGSFNFSSSGRTEESGDISRDEGSSTSFGLNPKGGLFLSEDFAIGLGIGINTSWERNPGNPDVIDKSAGFSIQPFARYYVVKMNKFSLFGEGQLGFSSNWSKVEVGGTTTDGPVTNTFGLSVRPGVSNDLNEKVALEAFVNGFNFAVSHKTEKTERGGTEVRERSSNFNLGANMDNIFTTGAISVGVIVKL
ncbi:MAG: hypothetical protein V5A51_12305 [Bacteroidales bacterium]